MVLRRGNLKKDLALFYYLTLEIKNIFPLSLLPFLISSRHGAPSGVCVKEPYNPIKASVTSIIKYKGRRGWENMWGGKDAPFLSLSKKEKRDTHERTTG